MPEKSPFICSFTIRSDTRYLSALRSWIGAAARVAGSGRLGKRERIALELALVEAVDNAIFHAHRGDAARPIRVTLSLADGEAGLEVVDTGRGIGHLSGSLPEAMSEHGRGLFLMRSMMTSVASRVSNGRHALRMRLSL
ncbi:MAG: ATP-binding protein [Proteobacteria bacterium]|nr:ATP-binding protein [Pseudomonadota bacterium]